MIDFRRANKREGVGGERRETSFIVETRMEIMHQKKRGIDVKCVCSKGAVVSFVEQLGCQTPLTLHASPAQGFFCRDCASRLDTCRDTCI